MEKMFSQYGMRLRMIAIIKRCNDGLKCWQAAGVSWKVYQGLPGTFAPLIAIHSSLPSCAFCRISRL